MEYIEIKEQIKQKLPVARDLGDSENLLELGLSSLTIMRLVNQWRKQGVKVSFGSLMENPTLEGWWALIQRSMKKKAGKKRAQESKITPEKDMKQPFPLTDVQYAYWVGRDEEQALGGIDCHAYLEFDGGNIDPERLEKAWNVLQYHHPMLRACFLEDGTQKILDKPYCEKIKVHDFSRMPSEEAEAMAVSVRERLSHRKLKIEEGEVAGIELTLFPENRARMHVDMALLVADVQSLQILLRDLAAAYRGESLPAESKGWNFASYLERQKEEDKEERNNAEGYWKKRLEHLPKGPGLPLAKRPQEVTKTVFNRRIVRIGKEEWAHLQVRAKEYQTTPAMVLLTAYATVLERWSRNHRFLINIPFFNRKTEQQGLEDVIADFTTLLLLEIDCEGNPTFAELLDRIQKQLHEDMKYTAYSGVQVQRDLAQMYGDASAVAPVVFACNLGTPLVNDTFRKELGQFSYMISQTPQVWNDFQSYEDENGVQLTWDSVDKLFPENMIPDMLECFENLLHELGKKDWNQRFDVLPEKRKREIEDTARTGVPERVECLHWAVMNHAEVCPEDIALIDAGSGRSVSYGELKARATAVAAGISEKDIKGVPVALTLPRGIEQIEAALGILLSGNSYLPVSLSQPKDRRALIHEKTGVRYVVTNRELSEKLDWPEGTEILVMEGMEEGQENVRLPEVSPKDSAYIIMTSGSTGVPKGVEIAHESAWNTVQDINEKYHVTSADRALAVSAMDFDLSVYDVFGILGAGGTLVLLPEQERRNADYWLEQVLKYQITVWNSVPVLLDMLLIRAESMKQKLPIRAVMLSGDWIGMDLPQRVAAWTEDCQFVAMGGATEASIWSNYQNVTLPMPKNWKSIPYGKPLRYQAYRVVDEYGRDCPYWAEGELWIGGFGVAKGYRGDSALTGQKFITDQYGRWYRTGDLGRIWDDETIEFLGRKDHQVKIRGHRIELGEIEHAIQEFPGVAHAVVDTVSDGHGNKTLAAYIGAPIQEDSKVTTYLYGTDIFGGGWKELKDDVSNWQMQQERKTAYKNFLAYADQRCVQLMLETLIELGIFVSEKEVLSQKEIFEKGSITETQKNTVARWLEILKKEGILREEDGRLSRTGKEVAVPEKAGDTETYFNKLKPYLKHMVTGNEVPLDVFYQKEPALAPNMLLRRIPGCEETVERLVQGLRLLAEERRKEPLQIIEIGTRDTAITRQFLNALEDVSVAYTYADSSKYFLQEAEKELAGYERVEFEMLNLEEGMDKQQMSLHSYDVVISVNALHRNIDAADAVKKVAELLKPNGILLMTDLVVRTYLQELTAAFLENGFADIRDKRKEAGLVTPDCLLWRECLSEAGLGEDCAVTERYGRCICCSRQQASVLSYHNGALREYLSEKLPEYMVPQNYHFMEQLPTLSNGKINRKQLREDFKEETAVIRFSKATTETEEKLLDIWKQLFGYENIGIEDNYFSLGGDSLIATRLISEVQKTFGCKITISTIFENLTVKSLAKAIEQSEQKEEDTLQIKPNLEEAYHPFPLTDVQYAYWLGRSGLYELGNVATHCYFELDADGLDTECAETAWNLLIQRHGMMRVIIQPDGMQRILENTPQYHIDVTDIRQLEVTEKEKALDEKRAEMSHQVIQTDEWPLFDVRITKIEDQKHRIHISFDNIIFDGWSMFHLLNEWAEVYRNGKAEMPITLSFRDYVLGLEQIKSTSAYEKDKKYWEDRVETFADAPDLPLAKNESQITEQRFCRRSAKLSQKEWQSVKDAAGRLEVTPSVLLMSAYAETLRLWSSNKDFTLNLTQFDRKQLHPEVNNLVGDFTTLTLLEIKNAGNNFAERTKAIQKQLIHNPRERVEKILRDSGTRIILVQNQAYDQDTEWLHEWDCISVSGLKTDSEYKAQENKAGDLAYVIYTSGTTGMPKGVMITHHNAVNTILDINARYQITEQDTAFGISNLHFDLSVYDVFGVLGAGGKLVLPDPEYGKDPAHWIHWLNHENITVWNSVPAFVEMLAEYEEYQRQVTSQSLRLVMMSGDWVPVSLPGRIRNLFQNVEIVALGGATEGSIWSNHFEIPEIVPEDWKSIPYGKPLANQKYYVLDQNMEDCPDWVPGTLYIAGDGVAQGYLNDNEKTEEKFVVLDRTGERLYCTGDMGRYWNEGNIEFLGRLDNQVKINGYRVELGEIEAALRRIQGITEAFVFFKRDNAIEDICAVLVEEKRYRDRIDKFYKEMLKKDLPIYMIPTEYIKTNAIPLNSNGKKDIHKILIVAEKNRKPIFKKNNNCKQLTQLQEQLLAIWREVLKIENIDINDNFFEIGGNSIQAIQITNQMTEKIGCFMDIGKLFEYPTISKIERYILEET